MPGSSVADLPLAVHSQHDIDTLDQAAHKLTTPCMAGQMVWRVWQPDAQQRVESAPVLLLHGGSGSWLHWCRNIVPLLQAGRCVIAPDLPGFGESAALGRRDDADAVPQWLDAGLVQLQAGLPPLEMAQGCDVVGFSFGGLIAGLLARQWPQQVRRLVLVGAPALYAGSTRQLDLKPWFHLHGAERASAQAYNLRSLMLARDASVDALALWINTNNLERDRMRQRRLARSDALGQALPSLQMPLWGLWGAEDPLVQGALDRIGPLLAQAPGFRGFSAIAGAGHWVQYEDAAAFNRTLLHMLATA